jgi:hypothetical protein
MSFAKTVVVVIVESIVVISTVFCFAVLSVGLDARPLSFVNIITHSVTYYSVMRTLKILRYLPIR